MNIISFFIEGLFFLGLFVLCILQRKGMRFNLRVACAAILGLAFGFTLQLWFSHEALKSFLPFFTLFTRIYTRALRLLVVPILLLGVMSVIISIYQSRAQKKVYAITGLATVILFINTALASLIGIGSAILFSVGNNLKGTDILEVIDPKYEYKGLWDAIIGYIPTNIFEVLSSSNALQVTIVAVLFGVAASASFALLRLPFTLVPLVQSVDFFIDMGRTALNVNGTITAAVSADRIIHNKDKSVEKGMEESMAVAPK